MTNNKDYQYDVLIPWAEVEQPPLHALTPRLDTLEGKTIGMFNSGKPASPFVLKAAEEKLREQFPAAKFSWFRLGHHYHGQPLYREPEHQLWLKKFKEWLQGVDAVILAQGD